jgi:exodeoxyribonuclease-1
MLTIAWHDFETSGVSPSRDRPVQFAMVRTDLDLNIIGKPTTLYCKPTPDHLPDPVACVLTGITPQVCEEVGLPEREFVEAIYRELSVPETIGVGYNTIAFDDEVTRFMLWRNLMDPYAREWKDGCGRWDIIDMVRATYALRPETMEWPRNSEGRVTFKLEELSKANGLLHESAHDALSDVYATIALARLIKERQPRLYDHYFSMREKARALREMDVALRDPFIFVTSGAPEHGGLRIMMPIAVHPTNKNEVIAWDLSKDPRQLLEIDAETMRKRLFTKRDERPEGFEPMPVRSIAANKSPAVVKQLAVLSDERAGELCIDKAAALANVPVMLEVLDARGDFFSLLKSVYARDPISCDADEALYAGFIDADDRRKLDQVRVMSPEEIVKAKVAFRDNRLDDLFLRYKARHYPDALSPRDSDRWEEYRYRKLVTGHSGSRTFAMVQESAARCRHEMLAFSADVDPGRLKILDDVLDYANRLAAVVDPFRLGAAPGATEDVGIGAEQMRSAAPR